MASITIVEVDGGSSSSHALQAWKDQAHTDHSGASLSLHGSQHAFAFSAEGTGTNDANRWTRPAPYGPIGSSAITYPLDHVAATSSVRQFRLRFTGFRYIRKARFWLEPYTAPDWTIQIGVGGSSPLMVGTDLFLESSQAPSLMTGWETTSPWETGLTVVPEIVAASSSSEYLTPIISVQASVAAGAEGPVIGYDEYGLALPLIWHFEWQGSDW